MDNSFETLRRIGSEIGEILRFVDQIGKLPTCNSCAGYKDCAYAPKWGQSVRYNCPHWIAWDKNDV